MANLWNQAPTVFDPVCYVPSPRKQALLALLVKAIRVAGHEKVVGKTGRSDFTNHWCLYLQMFGKGSVQIDCQPSYSVRGTVIQGGSKANIIVSEIPDDMSREVIKYTELVVRTGLTVGNVVDLLLTCGRHKYEFTSEGVGCRKWVSDQVELLYEQGVVVSKTQCETTRDTILKLWPDGTPLDIEDGKYYQ
ncbi:MAG: hypothetical protein M1840_006703 [Geoglossum simile]|nr:MAG: hypothetical protein M1840_006703 [Geoglossum simile]